MPQVERGESEGRAVEWEEFHDSAVLSGRYPGPQEFRVDDELSAHFPLHVGAEMNVARCPSRDGAARYPNDLPSELP